MIPSLMHCLPDGYWQWRKNNHSLIWDNDAHFQQAPPPMPNITILNSRHRALGARMVDFGGWDMPLNYGSQIEEHHQVRRDAGMFDVSHMAVIDITGEDVRAFLRHLLANSVDKLSIPGKALYTCMLNERGGVIDDLIVYFLTESWFRLVVNAATREKDLAWIRQHARAFKVNVRERDELAIIAVQGPTAREHTIGVLPAAHADTLGALKRFSSVELDSPFGSLFIARTGYTGEDGFEIILEQTHAPALWDALLDTGVKPAGLGARDTLRLEAGLPLYGQDMDEETTPLEAGLGWTLTFDPGREFIGRTALEAQQNAGIQQQLIGLVMDAKGVLRHGQPVHTAHGIGKILSGTFSPTLATSIALARVPAGGLTPADTAAGTSVEIRGKQVPVRVVPLPFVRNGQPAPGVTATTSKS